MSQNLHKIIGQISYEAHMQKIIQQKPRVEIDAQSISTWGFDCDAPLSLVESFPLWLMFHLIFLRSRFHIKIEHNCKISVSTQHFYYMYEIYVSKNAGLQCFIKYELTVRALQ